MARGASGLSGLSKRQHKILEILEEYQILTTRQLAWTLGYPMKNWRESPLRPPLYQSLRRLEKRGLVTRFKFTHEQSRRWVETYRNDDARDKGLKRPIDSYDEKDPVWWKLADRGFIFSGKVWPPMNDIDRSMILKSRNK